MTDERDDTDDTASGYAVAIILGFVGNYILDVGQTRSDNSTDRPAHSATPDVEGRCE